MKEFNDVINNHKKYKITLTEFWNSKKPLAIHCDTEKKANKLLKAFNKLGKKWASETPYTKESFYNECGRATCYSNNHEYSSYDYYKEKKYTIYEFENVDLNN